MTALDNALAEARKNKDQSPKFYELFLNTGLYFPLLELPKENDPRRLRPILIENSGSKYLMLFDETARLESWAKREIPYAQVPGHAILRMMDPSILVVLNVGTEYMHQFVADELAWLRRAMQPTPSSGASMS